MPSLESFPYFTPDQDYIDTDNTYYLGSCDLKVRDPTHWPEPYCQGIFGRTVKVGTGRGKGTESRLAIIAKVPSCAMCSVCPSTNSA
ncbi:MAG: hypothetical protein WC885_02615, partial [Candidatus Shapirobacteria bacterium]